MGLYAQFYVSHDAYAVGEGQEGDPIKVAAGLGDRAIIELDPRDGRETHHALARDWIRRHETAQGFVAYRLFAGSILSPRYITQVLRPDGSEILSGAVHDYTAPASARRPVPGRERHPRARRRDGGDPAGGHQPPRRY